MRLNAKTATAMILDFSHRTGVAVEDILGSSRRAHIVAVRQLYWKFLRDEAKFSFSEIANLCDVNHSSVIHGVRMAREKIEVGDKLILQLWELVKDVEC
jgi:chromosomal replication initiation ATPase DnaA